MVLMQKLPSTARAAAYPTISTHHMARGSFADPDPDPDQCAGRRSASAAEKPVSMPRFALSGSCRGAAVTISPRISRTAPYTEARRHFHLRMVRRSSGVSLNGKDLGFIRASIGWTLPIYDP